MLLHVQDFLGLPELQRRLRKDLRAQVVGGHELDHLACPVQRCPGIPEGQGVLGE